MSRFSFPRLVKDADRGDACGPLNYHQTGSSPVPSSTVPRQLTDVEAS
jgi:hypothetical protein